MGYDFKDMYGDDNLRDEVCQHIKSTYGELPSYVEYSSKGKYKYVLIGEKEISNPIKDLGSEAFNTFVNQLEEGFYYWNN